MKHVTQNIISDGNVSRIHPLGNMNVYRQSLGNPSIYAAIHQSGIKWLTNHAIP